ncbi:DUF805 domain-containing protein [Methylobacterium sp. A52T]
MTSYFSLSGHIGRLEYLVRSIKIASLSILLSSLTISLAAIAIYQFKSELQPRDAFVVFFPIAAAIFAPALWSSICITVRRVRDIGWSPWIVLGWIAFD